MSHKQKTLYLFWTNTGFEITDEM